MKQLLTVVLSLFCLVISADNAEIPDMKFRRLDTRDGLSNSQINCLFQDSKGYVWIGTSYGLNRYDGYRFRTFYSDPSDTTSLRSNYVDMIMEVVFGTNVHQKRLELVLHFQENVLIVIYSQLQIVH